MKQRILTLYHIFNLEISVVAFITGKTEHFVKQTIDDYTKPFTETENFIIIESKMNNL